MRLDLSLIHHDLGVILIALHHLNLRRGMRWLYDGRLGGLGLGLLLSLLLRYSLLLVVKLNSFKARYKLHLLVLHVLVHVVLLTVVCEGLSNLLKLARLIQRTLKRGHSFEGVIVGRGSSAEGIKRELLASERQLVAALIRRVLEQVLSRALVVLLSLLSQRADA